MVEILEWAALIAAAAVLWWLASPHLEREVKRREKMTPEQLLDDGWHIR
jgi:hypothetical protein